MKGLFLLCFSLPWWRPLIQASYCPPTGPVLPAPRIETSAAEDSLSRQLRKALQSIAQSSTESSISVQVTTANETVFEWYRTGSDLDEQGASEIDGDTIYRIASVTKVFTVLALLRQSNVPFDDLVVKYVPELADVPSFQGVTLQMLASQLSGLPRDGYISDLAAQYTADELAEMGLPEDPSPPPGVPTCDALLTGGDPCTREEFIQVLATANHTWMPGHRAAYSNLGFVALGIVLEDITGKPFVEIIRDEITQPLGMNSTGFEALDFDNLIVPEGALQVANLTVHNYNATGGLYSTPNDLSQFLRGILGNELLTGVQIRNWLKPAAFTSSQMNTIGSPWEIFRPDDLVSPSRPIALFTKVGSLPGYETLIALIPEYRAGVVIQIAGPDSYEVTRKASDAVIRRFVPFAENLARTQAEATYTGRYVGGNGSSITLDIDKGPGLRIMEWSSRGVDMISMLAERSRVAEEDGIDMRAYPVGWGGLPVGDGEVEEWVINVEVEKGDDDGTIWAAACETWFFTDQARLAALPLDALDFVIQDDKAVSVGSPGLREQWARVE